MSSPFLRPKRSKATEARVVFEPAETTSGRIVAESPPRFEQLARLERFELLTLGGVVVVAVKRNNRSPDELTIMLVQVKGGRARATKEEL